MAALNNAAPTSVSIGVVTLWIEAVHGLSDSMKTLASFTRALSLVLTVTGAFIWTAHGDTNLTSLPTPLPHLAPDVSNSHQQTASSQKLSHDTTQVIQLTQSGIDESVVLSYIRNLGAFNLVADHIIYLNDVGVSSRIVNAMLAHDREITSRQDSSTSTNNLVPSLNVPVAADASLSHAQNLIGTAQTVAAMDKHCHGTVPQSVNVSTDAQATALSEIESSKRAPVTSAKPSLFQPTTEKRKALYPVREPYPVELTVPIVLLEYPTF
jgi:hypothetical protein